jgi:hypothetical protein
LTKPQLQPYLQLEKSHTIAIPLATAKISVATRLQLKKYHSCNLTCKLQLAKSQLQYRLQLEKYSVATSLAIEKSLSYNISCNWKIPVPLATKTS